MANKPKYDPDEDFPLRQVEKAATKAMARNQALISFAPNPNPLRPFDSAEIDRKAAEYAGRNAAAVVAAKNQRETNLANTAYDSMVRNAGEAAPFEMSKNRTARVVNASIAREQARTAGPAERRRKLGDPREGPYMPPEEAVPTVLPPRGAVSPMGRAFAQVPKWLGNAAMRARYAPGSPTTPEAAGPDGTSPMDFVNRATAAGQKLYDQFGKPLAAQARKNLEPPEGVEDISARVMGQRKPLHAGDVIYEGKRGKHNERTFSNNPYATELRGKNAAPNPMLDALELGRNTAIQKDARRYEAEEFKKAQALAMEPRSLDDVAKIAKIKAAEGAEGRAMAKETREKNLFDLDMYRRAALAASNPDVEKIHNEQKPIIEAMSEGAREQQFGTRVASEAAAISTFVRAMNRGVIDMNDPVMQEGYSLVQDQAAKAANRKEGQTSLGNFLFSDDSVLSPRDAPLSAYDVSENPWAIAGSGQLISGPEGPDGGRRQGEFFGSPALLEALRNADNIEKKRKELAAQQEERQAKIRKMERDLYGGY